MIIDIDKRQPLELFDGSDDELIYDENGRRRYTINSGGGSCCGGVCAIALVTSPDILLRGLYDFVTNIPLNKIRDANLAEELVRYYQTDLRQAILDRGIQIKCKFHPSCSEYALEAIRTYGQIKGSTMALERLVRCNPSSEGGYDPVVR
jgi:putative membrane protein insertion efficiency factor